MIFKKTRCNYVAFIFVYFAQIELWPVEANDFKKFSVPKRFEGNNESVLYYFDHAVRKYDPSDHAKGVPGYKPSGIVINGSANTVRGNYSPSQYSQRSGIPRLANAVAKFYSKVFNKTLDPEKNVMITEGATEALYIALQTHTSPGDEWILFKPLYKSYLSIFKAARAVPRFIPLRLKKRHGTTSSRDWVFDRREMARAFNHKTKGIYINTPNNPTGKMFTRNELEFIANLAKKWNTLVLTDEFLNYNNNKRIGIASLPGMFERTITVSSASKSFGATSFRVGWAYGGAQIMRNLASIHPSRVDSDPTPYQEAISAMIEKELESFGTKKSHFYRFEKNAEKRGNYSVKSSSDAKFSPTDSQTTVFLRGNWPP